MTISINKINSYYYEHWSNKMIGISKLYCGTVEPSDALRYGRDSSKLPSHLLQFSKDKKPVVVWNMGRRCNLKCVHCYAQSKDIEYKNELTTQQGKDLIDDLAQFGAPVILFSGGEPIMRKDLPELAQYARSKGMRAVISTNGTLIDRKMAKVLKDIGLSYVGVSLDGMRETNDKFRGMKGAFDAALNGMRNCLAEGVKVGLRFTINKKNVKDIPAIFDLLEKEKIPRVCFYHLVYAGRGSKLVEQELSHEESRKTLDLIMDRTKALHDRGFPIEVLTVDNHCDGPYVYFRLLKEDPKRAAEVYELLQMNQGNSSGIGIGCVSWDGSVHADQFWRHYSFGNVKERKFSEIWTDTSNELMAGLKSRKPLIKANADRCAHCKWFDICNGNFRVRAEAIYGNVWADDPACYLTKEEIGYDETK
jgi:12,18-didecarboxysiroheme deacetylase